MSTTNHGSDLWYGEFLPKWESAHTSQIWYHHTWQWAFIRHLAHHLVKHKGSPPSASWILESSRATEKHELGPFFRGTARRSKVKIFCATFRLGQKSPFGKMWNRAGWQIELGDEDVNPYVFGNQASILSVCTVSSALMLQSLKSPFCHQVLFKPAVKGSIFRWFLGLFRATAILIRVGNDRIGHNAEIPGLIDAFFYDALLVQHFEPEM